MKVYRFTGENNKFFTKGNVYHAAEEHCDRDCLIVRDNEKETHEISDNYYEPETHKWFADNFEVVELGVNLSGEKTRAFKCIKGIKGFFTEGKIYVECNDSLKGFHMKRGVPESGLVVFDDLGMTNAIAEDAEEPYADDWFCRHFREV